MFVVGYFALFDEKTYNIQMSVSKSWNCFMQIDHYTELL